MYCMYIHCYMKLVKLSLQKKKDNNGGPLATIIRDHLGASGKYVQIIKYMYIFSNKIFQVQVQVQD